MDRIPITLEGIESLSELLKPIAGVFVSFLTQRNVGSVLIEYTDGSAVRIRNTMYDIAPRWEVGVITISQESTRDRKRGECIKKYCDIFPKYISKLLLNLNGILVESGLEINCGSKSIYILPSAHPFCLSIFSNNNDEFFSPEYIFDEYSVEMIPLKN